MRVITTCPTCGVEVVYTDTGIVLPGAAPVACSAGHVLPVKRTCSAACAHNRWAGCALTLDKATDPHRWVRATRFRGGSRNGDCSEYEVDGPAAPAVDPSPSTVPTGETVVFMSPRNQEAFLKNLRRALSADERYRTEESDLPAQEGPVPLEVEQQEWRNPWPLAEPALFSDDVPILWTEEQQERIREMVIGVDPALPGSERRTVVIMESAPGGASHFERVRRALRAEAVDFGDHCVLDALQAKQGAGEALRRSVEAHIPPPPEPARPMNRAQRRKAERLEAWRRRRT